ncbi:hypothetical protein DIZ81_08255 [Legionella taurinensis]|uniref:Uncharacterized protein n=1 Tax=Legionella taurinensis TaxID=70611 RepID=A0A3A5LKX2_9GAMM|nr:MULTISPECIES: hypothetical protein [Legionella]MDX1837707.1 hypothetical protein [Legionella taurinensis]PUT39989.1 hypothetical protein DB744_08255 [Legionella taurinensis]PUT43755.1 hypothetical protein DB746_05580 [Legionella taurinensis]PUT46112.1 hypothetical protein DB743_05170 [Legionella taurinensis]PUT47910.1 hypothetical protein DB745_06660 [Legionella taurinensis]
MENGIITKKRLTLETFMKNVDVTREQAIDQSILIRKAIAHSEKQKKEYPGKKEAIENQLKKYDELLKQLLTVIDEINAHSPDYQHSMILLEEAERGNPQAPTVR